MSLRPEYSSASLAERLGGRLVGAGDLRIRGVDALDTAAPDVVTFIADARRAHEWAGSSAIAALVTEGLEPVGHDPQRRALIYVPDAELALIDVLSLFALPAAIPDDGVAPAAWVHADATLGARVRVGPHASIDRGCVIGDDVVVHAGVRLYADVTVGAGSVLHANTVVRQCCTIGRGVIMHQNVSIGADGFGYRPAADGSGLVKMPHIGTVIIEDAVEIGAGTCVDRGKMGVTVIGAGTKIDNLVQIAHNCRVGRSCAIAAGAKFGGSVTIGDGVLVGGGVLVADHIRLGHGAKIGGGSAIMKDVPDGETWFGHPGNKSTATLRQWAAVRKLPGYFQRIGSADSERQGRPGPGDHPGPRRSPRTR